MNFNNAIIITKKFVIGKLQPREKRLKVEMMKYEVYVGARQCVQWFNCAHHPGSPSVAMAVCTPNHSDDQSVTKVIIGKKGRNPLLKKTHHCFE